jgi:hypothetical protein
MLVWHGNVMDGMTLVALSVYAERAISAFKWGQFVWPMASGRKPSIMMKKVGYRMRLL